MVGDRFMVCSSTVYIWIYLCYIICSILVENVFRIHYVMSRFTLENIVSLFIGNDDVVRHSCSHIDFENPPDEIIVLTCACMVDRSSMLAR